MYINILQLHLCIKVAISNTQCNSQQENPRRKDKHRSTQNTKDLATRTTSC